MHYVEIITLASNAQMLSLNSHTCQVSDTLTSAGNTEECVHDELLPSLGFQLQRLKSSKQTKT